MVALYHMTVASQERLGIALFGNFFATSHTAVDLFLVLSGFVITYVHRRDIGRRERCGQYLVKRFIRLYPLYWIIAATKVAAMFLYPALAQDYQEGWAYMIKSFLLIPQEHLPIIGAAWMLSYQILFYLLFGAAIALGSRWAVLIFSTWTLAILGSEVSKAVGAPLVPSTPFTLYALGERNLDFIFGCMGALLVPRAAVKWGRVLALLGVVLFVLSNVYLGSGGEITYFSLYFGLPAALVIAGSAVAEVLSPLVMLVLGQKGLTPVAFAPVRVVHRDDGEIIAHGRLETFEPLAVEVVARVLRHLLDQRWIRVTELAFAPPPAFGEKVRPTAFEQVGFVGILLQETVIVTAEGVVAGPFLSAAAQTPPVEVQFVLTGVIPLSLDDRPSTTQSLPVLHRR